MDILYKINRMRELILDMQKESQAYYIEDNPIVTDREYDAKFDELRRLESESKLIYPDSPTQVVSGGVLDSLQKVQHSKPMLSADKTKDFSALLKFVQRGEREYAGCKTLISWKYDGLTIVLRYKCGRLSQAITRGDGEVGEDVTHTVRTFTNVPLQIPYELDCEVRCEGIIPWSEFERINEASGGQYSHPRNLVAGAVRQLDPSATQNFGLRAIAFELVKPEMLCRQEEEEFLSHNGFEVARHRPVLPDDMQETIQSFDPKDYPYPVDGLVFDYSDNVYSRKLGATGHHENCRIALKWEDETYKTIFRSVAYRTGRTGKVSMTAVFDPVVIDGSVVSRATLHNVTFFEKLQLGVGDAITVYKANKIIPAIAENLTRSGTYSLPIVCPCCGYSLSRQKSNLSESLICPNEMCFSRNIGALEHFVAKPAANIDGLGKGKLEALVSGGYITAFHDIYRLSAHPEIQRLDGFGERSYQRLLDSIEKSRQMNMARFLICFGIREVGKTASRALSRYFAGDIDALLTAVDTDFDFCVVPDFGDVMCKNLKTFLLDTEVRAEIVELRKEIQIQSDERSLQPQIHTAFFGKTIVVTGSFAQFTREELHEKLETMGAKIGSSVSKNTDLLIAGEKAGSKLKKAIEFGTDVLREEDIIRLL